MKRETKIIALAGKGGVGKTSISAAVVRLLAENFPGKRVLAIDADPAVGLSSALGVEPEQTLEDIRKNIIRNVENGETREAVELLGEARFGLFDAMKETEGFSFIAIGRPEASGCYCKINSYLREVISLLAMEFDFVVIDGEAGIEQINRRVMEKVTHLLTVTDPSRKGTQVVRTIRKVADELVMYEQIGAVVNRVGDAAVRDLVDTGGVGVLSYIGNDDSLAMMDVMGEDIFTLPADSPMLLGVSEALSAMGLLESGGSGVQESCSVLLQTKEY